MSRFESRGLEFGEEEKKKRAAPEEEPEKEPKEKKPKKARKIHQIHIRHTREHPKGPGFVVRHHFTEGEPEEHHVPAEHEGDLDGLHDHLEKHFGTPNEGEAALGKEIIHGAAEIPSLYSNAPAGA